MTHIPNNAEPDRPVAVEISNRQQAMAVNLAWLERIVRGAIAVIRAEAAEISVLVVNDRRIAKLHAEWMQISEPTDVLTFDLGSDPPRRLAGDIVVSGETARRVARNSAGNPGRNWRITWCMGSCTWRVTMTSLRANGVGCANASG